MAGAGGEAEMLAHEVPDLDYELPRSAFISRVLATLRDYHLVNGS